MNNSVENSVEEYEPCGCRKYTSYKDLALEEIEHYRKIGAPKSLCNTAEMQIQQYYQTRPDTSFMFPTSTISFLSICTTAQGSIGFPTL